MDLDKQKLLYTRYPMLFSGREFFFECGDGWFDLIDGLCAQLVDACAQLSEQERELVSIFQIKEKMGELRVYLDADEVSEEMDRIIDRMSIRSLTICELCGSEGRRRGANYCVRVRCDRCLGQEDGGT